jgi:photosystem II stability/assembly factor-like uncharacterized protein
MRLARNSAIGLVALVTTLLLSDLSVSGQVAPAKPAKAATPSQIPKLKAIWEPVNYGEDLELTDVYFASPLEGWVTGAAGTILHTSDGGKTWKAQLGGDPKAADRPISQLRFIDATHGFAAQSTGVGDHNLLRTSDGQTWDQPGKVAQHRADYRFVSPTTGFVTDGQKILRSQDTGKTWQPVYDCKIKTEVQGLTRDVACNPSKLAFPSANIGYAVTQGVGPNGLVIAKTENGGTTWTAQLILPGEDAREGALTFIDQKIGILRAGAKMFRSTDGGGTWTGAIGEIGGKPDVKFADSAVGWAIAYQTMSYTTDGGAKWTARKIAFPAAVNAFTFAGKDDGYVVGGHGMVYRYHVVPSDYMAKGMLDAPMMR